MLARPADAGLAENLLEEFLGDLANPPYAPPLNYGDDPRLRWLVALLDSHPQDKFLLICRCQPKLHALEEALRLRSGVALARFHEGLGIVQRDRNAAYFAQADGARLLLATEIGSEGRNFQFAHRLVLWDLPLDPDLLEQRIGRLDRIGQRHPIAIHLAVLEHSAQHALARWYDQGMNAFRQSPEDGRELLKRFGARVAACACDLERRRHEAEAQLQELIGETTRVHAELAERIAAGRDRLLEFASRRAAGDENLRHALLASDADAQGDAYIERLLEHCGVQIEEHGQRTVLLDPDLVSSEALPGLADGPAEATFDRGTALVREELPFLRPDHPLVQAALDQVLGGERGNAAFAVDPKLPARTALLEAGTLPAAAADSRGERQPWRRARRPCTGCRGQSPLRRPPGRSGALPRGAGEAGAAHAQRLRAVGECARRAPDRRRSSRRELGTRRRNRTPGRARPHQPRRAPRGNRRSPARARRPARSDRRRPPAARRGAFDREPGFPRARQVACASQAKPTAWRPSICIGSERSDAR